MSMCAHLSHVCSLFLDKIILKINLILDTITPFNLVRNPWRFGFTSTLCFGPSASCLLAIRLASHHKATRNGRCNTCKTHVTVSSFDTLSQMSKKPTQTVYKTNKQKEKTPTKQVCSETNWKHCQSSPLSEPHLICLVTKFCRQYGTGTITHFWGAQVVLARTLLNDEKGSIIYIYKKIFSGKNCCLKAAKLPPMNQPHSCSRHGYRYKQPRQFPASSVSRDAAAKMEPGYSCNTYSQHLRLPGNSLKQRALCPLRGAQHWL